MLSSRALATLTALVIGIGTIRPRLSPPWWKRLRRLGRWLRLRWTAPRYALVPAHECSEEERRFAAELVTIEFGPAAGDDAAAVMQRSTGAAVPIVWLALELPSRAVVGHACWESAVIRSARPGGVAAMNYVSKLAAKGAGEAEVRQRGKLHGLSRAQVDDILAECDVTESTKTLPSEGVTVSKHPEYAPYFKMLKYGLPPNAVKQKLAWANLNPDAINRPDAPAPRPVATATPKRKLPKVKTFDSWTEDKGGCVSLSRLVVKLEHRGLGLGGALTLLGAAHCAELGATLITGLARSAALISYYEDLGAVSLANSTENVVSPRWMERKMVAKLKGHDCARVELVRLRLSSETHITF